MLHRAQLPFLFLSSQAVRALLGPELAQVAVLALRAVLARRGTLDVAHQQIVYRQHYLAFSTRVGSRGDVIVELDVGDERLAGRIVLEDDLRRATQRQREAGMLGRTVQRRRS